MPTQINTNEIHNDAVTNTKLATDSGSLAKVSGDKIKVEGSTISINSLLVDKDNNDIFITYNATSGLIDQIDTKDKSSNIISSMKINRDANSIITSVEETIGSTKITHTLNRDENGKTISLTKVIS